MNDPGLAFFENSKFALNMLSILGLGLIKSSILVLYLSLFPNKTFKWITWGALAYVGCWTVSFFFSHLFTCYPITTFIDFFEDKHCVNQAAMFLTVLYTNVVADFAILALPIPMILGLQLRLKTKLAVIGMLSLGAATCGISVARVIAITSVASEYVRHPNDIIYYTAPVFYWTNIELSMAVVCACLPTLRPIWFHFYPKAAATGSSSYEYGYGGRGAANSKRSGTGRHLNGSGSNPIRSTPYTEIDEMELTDNASGKASSRYGAGAGAGGGPRDIVKKTVIAQTVDDVPDNSSTSDLRPRARDVEEGGAWRGGYGRGL
ncbi:hypothetical protein Micbo1qcDRAFT_126086 [Microdochium bolleyi]|uniref:Rhodopsin domain-containing protein n=1 Tax=Microdochium bolleyi TaxID=196109 RepID=A0A136INX2_9PEZI|nr:hypothetical protein Micbo1qcDRAFT_126086 [Microdochium bolleyi]